jgi:peroxin-5
MLSYTTFCDNIVGEAAEHFLEALSQHGQRHRNTSKNLWDTLRKTFLLMDREDLAGLAHEGADIGVFRRDFNF